jgi:hypothetical protein
MVKKNGILIRILVIAFVIILVAAATIFVKMNYFSSENGFSASTILIKLNIALNNEATDNVQITNNELTTQTFNLRFNNLDNLASVEDKEFSLASGESKNVKISFKDNNHQIGIYTGQLIIGTFGSTKKIPIILGIEDANPSFAIIQGSIPKYENVYPGGKLGVEIKVFDLTSISSPNVRVKYSIKNFDNVIIWSDEEDLIIGESLNKIIDLPNIPLGNYVFITTIDYQGTESISGYLFNVMKKEQIPYETSNFFILIILFFVVGSLILLFYFIKRSDDLLIQLRKQQSNELKHNLDLLGACKTKVKNLQHPKKTKEWKLIQKKIIKRIKHKHKIQRMQLKKLRKKGKKEELHRKLNSWKKSGFKMIEAEKEIKNVSDTNVNKQLENFKKQGYNVGFLNKKGKI